MSGIVTEVFSGIAAYTATGRTRRRIQKRKQTKKAKDEDESRLSDPDGERFRRVSYIYQPPVPFYRSTSFIFTATCFLLLALLLLGLELVPDPQGPANVLQDGGGEAAAAGGEDADIPYWTRTRAKLVKVYRWMNPGKKLPKPHEHPRGMKGAPHKRVQSRENIWKAGEELAIQKGALDATFHRNNMRWTGMQRGEQVTIELFLQSHCTDSGFCAEMWQQIHKEFDKEQVRVTVNYIGGGLERNKASQCPRGDLECDGNIAGLCAQKYLRAPRHVLDVLQCQADNLPAVPSNLDHCLLEIGATIDEVEDIHKCIDFNEGQKLFELSSSYSAIVLPSVKRRTSCTMRLLDKSGKEKSTCTRTKGIFSTSCKHRTNAVMWKKHLCNLIGPEAAAENAYCSFANLAMQT